MLDYTQKKEVCPDILSQDIEKRSRAPKKVLAIHDLSCFGRCALTVIIPVLSVMGFQAVPLPTAILSTHTGGFSNFTFLDLSEKMTDIASHWKDLNIGFDAIYTGFLGSEAQCELIDDIIDNFAENKTQVLIDPVMGDEGKLYKTITPAIGERMKSLVSKADIITPNVTEACFLLDRKYKEPSENEVLDILKRLCDMGAKNAVLTGMHLHRDRIATACYNSEKGTFDIYENPRLPQQYPGTGDVFASVLLGEIMRGKELVDASATASCFVYDVMLDTSADSVGNKIDDNRCGIYLEKHLGKLI